jgi:hypothetical protein
LAKAQKPCVLITSLNNLWFRPPNDLCFIEISKHFKVSWLWRNEKNTGLQEEEEA